MKEPGHTGGEKLQRPRGASYGRRIFSDEIGKVNIRDVHPHGGGYKIQIGTRLPKRLIWIAIAMKRKAITLM